VRFLIWMRNTVCMQDTLSMLEYIGCETLYVDEKHSAYARHYVNITIHRRRATVYG